MTAVDRVTRYAEPYEEERRTSVGWIVVSLLALVLVGVAAFLITRALAGIDTPTVTTVVPTTSLPQTTPTLPETTATTQRQTTTTEERTTTTERQTTTTERQTTTTEEPTTSEPTEST